MDIPAASVMKHKIIDNFNLYIILFLHLITFDSSIMSFFLLISAGARLASAVAVLPTDRFFRLSCICHCYAQGCGKDVGDAAIVFHSHYHFVTALPYQPFFGCRSSRTEEEAFIFRPTLSSRMLSAFGMDTEVTGIRTLFFVHRRSSARLALLS